MGLDVADNLTLTRLSGMGPGSLVLPRQQRSVAAEWIARLGIVATRDKPLESCRVATNRKQPWHGCSITTSMSCSSTNRRVASTSRARLSSTRRSTRSSLRRSAMNESRVRSFVSSQLPELIGLCDRIAVMHRGRLGEPRPATEWDEHRSMLAATGAEAAA